MIQETSTWSIKRILVPLDASMHSQAALKAGVKLAASFKAQLIALFVEDINLLQLSELSFAREICSFSPTCRLLNRSELERQFRVQAANIRQSVLSLAERYDVKWEFKVVRGAVTAQIQAAQAEADLTILGKTGWSLAGSSRIGSTVQTIISKGRGLTMIFQQGKHLEIPVLVIYTGSSISQKALKVGYKLLQQINNSLTVIIPAKSREAFQKIEHNLNKDLENMDLCATIRYIRPGSLVNFKQTLQWEGQGPLVIPAEEPYFCGNALENLLNMISNPVVLVQNQ